MSKRAVVFRTDEGSGEAVPTYRFVDPYRPTVELEHPCYCKSSHPVDAYHTPPGTFSITEPYVDSYVAPYNGPGYGTGYQQPYTALPVPGWSDGPDFPAGTVYPGSTTTRVITFGPMEWDSDAINVGIQFQSGANLGQNRFVSGFEPFVIVEDLSGAYEDWDHQVLVLDRPLPNTPAFHDRYDLFINCSGYSAIQVVFPVRREFSSTIQVRSGRMQVFLMDYNKPGQISKYYADQAEAMQEDPRFLRQFGYMQGSVGYHYKRYQVECKGAMGVKINPLGFAQFGFYFGGAT